MEEVKQSQSEAEASFAAGFAKVSGEPPKETPDPLTAEPAAEKKPEPIVSPEDEAKAAAEREWEAVPKVVRDRLQQLESIPGQISKLAGHVGGFKSQLTEAMATAKAAAEKRGEEVPTERQAAQAMTDPEAWKDFERDWPEMAQAIGAKLAASQGAPAPKVDLDGFRGQVSQDIQGAIDVAEERAYLRLKYPDWRDTVKTPDFAEWFKSQPQETQALGGSMAANDAITLLDAYAQAGKAKAAAEAEKQRNTKRLLGAVTPNGVASPPVAGISDEEAFNRGFKRAVGK